MARRRYHRRKRKNNEVYLGFLITILLIIREILIFIKENPYIIYLGLSAIIGTLVLKCYLNKIKEQKRKQQEKEYLRRCRTINSLLNKYENKPTEFEQYVAKVFNNLGYKTKVTSRSNDGGKDIVMYKDNSKYVVEVKLYQKNNKISRGKIQKLHSAMIDCNADKAIFVTTSDFTKNSIDYAHKHGIELINGDKFVKLIDRAIGDKQQINIVNNISWLIEDK